MDLLTSILASLFAALMLTGFHNQYPLLTLLRIIYYEQVISTLYEILLLFFFILYFFKHETIHQQLHQFIN